jgi:hypothetical protein
MDNVGVFYYHFKYITYVHVVYFVTNFVAIWYIFPRFGILCQEKSGNPAKDYTSHRCFFYQNKQKDFYRQHD